MSRVFVIICFLLINVLVYSQADTGVFQRYYYPGGQVSSEGRLIHEKPDGYWKTYHENGKLKSEGNRKHFELDSLWKFYDEEGKLILSINYSRGKKNGLRKTYREGEYTEESFVNDIKEGLTTIYYPSGKVMRIIPYVNGLENGTAREYDSTGNLVSLVEYKRGFILSRENINRYDRDGKKQGVWKQFWDNGNIRSEGNYLHDRKNGYFKEYMTDGKLFKIFKYENDSLIPDAEEVAKIDERADYYSNGRVRVMMQYKNNQPDGIRREYSAEGRLEKGAVYSRGVKIADGLTDEAGLRQGPWKDYYYDGRLKAEGKYKDGRRTGPWKFWYQNGRVEQEGQYDLKGLADGLWQWFYEDGDLRMEEEFSGGKEDGKYAEYDENGNIIVKGEYIEGLKQGDWVYNYGDFREEGHYQDGLRDGGWAGYYSNGNKAYEGRFVEDMPDGRHVYYWTNGNKKDEGFYVMGRREGDWSKYEMDGSLFLIITYKNGTEKKFDGMKIVPELEDE